MSDVDLWDPAAALRTRPPAALDGLSPEHRQLFELRCERWLPDMSSGLAALYSNAQCDALLDTLLDLAARCYAERPADLHRLDLTRTLAPDWFQRPTMLGYAAYCDRFGTDLQRLRDQIPYLVELGVTYLHLMPLLRPREGDSDGGYAVADYDRMRADLGSMDDLAELAAELRANGISLVADLVLNHVAYEHDWAARARAGDQRYRDYFHVFEDRAGPAEFEANLPEVFPDFAPGNFSYDPDLAAWVWTTFNTFQWDTNWSNPQVLAEYAAIVLRLANNGVEVLRLDAIAFLWKRLGTNCQNQPEVHAIAQVLRALLRIACPATLLKAEAIVAPDDLVHYLGRGRHHGKVSDLAYHNVLMVQIWSMLACRDVRLAVRSLQQMPAVPATTAWICYVRCHDDIGWAIDDMDASSVGLSGWAHRAFLSDYYTGQFPGSFADGLTFQANEKTGDRRVSGMTASLAGLAGAHTADERDLAVRRVLLAHAIVLGWGGIPVIWMGDELAMGNDEHWAAEPGHGEDNRWTNRPRMDTAAQAQRRDPATTAGTVFLGLRRLIATRSRLPFLHASVPARVLDPSDPGVLAVLRSHPEGQLLELFNVSESWRPFPYHRLVDHGLAPAFDVLSDDAVLEGEDGNVWLAPYQAVWIIASGG